MKCLTQSFVMLAMVFLVGCAGTTVRPDIQVSLAEMGLELGEINSRVPSYRVNGWKSLDDLNLIVTAGVNDKYLVQLQAPCIGLRGAFFIGFTTPSFGLDRFDSVLVRGPGRRMEACAIADIVRLYPIAE